MHILYWCIFSKCLGLCLGTATDSDSSCVWHRPINEEEIGHLKEQRYGAIADKQTMIDEKIKSEVWLISSVLPPHLPAVCLKISFLIKAPCEDHLVPRYHSVQFHNADY